MSTLVALALFFPLLCIVAGLMGVAAALIGVAFHKFRCFIRDLEG